MYRKSRVRGSQSVRWGQLFEKPCGTKDLAPCGWKPQWGAVKAQTDQANADGVHVSPGENLPLSKNGARIGNLYIDQFVNITEASGKRGIEVKLRYLNSTDAYKGFNWIQTVNTNDPIGGKPNLSIDGPQPYNPARSSDDQGTVFYDCPGRSSSKNSINWTAELSLIGKNSASNRYEILQTVKYGFSVNAAGVFTSFGPDIVSPSSFQRGALP
jgi:hypothetical protein